MNLDRAVETEEFHRKSLIINSTNWALKKGIVSFCDERNKQEYSKQLDVAAQNVGLLVDNLLNFNIMHLPVLGSGIMGWAKNYFHSQNSCKDKEKYLVYTNLDNKIPFIPEEDVMYTYMIAQLAYIGRKMSEHLPVRDMKKLVDSFIDISALGTEAFDVAPTIMPRFHNHNRINLKVIQALDKPLTCCPSLHIAYSLLLDNVAENLLKDKLEPEVLNSIRYSSKRMFNSVLYTKQHSLIDIAFGTLSSKISFENNFDKEFNDFTEFYAELQGENPHVNYGKLYDMYLEALYNYEENLDFGDAVLNYFEDHDFPRVRPGVSIDHCWFDMKKGKICC